MFNRFILILFIAVISFTGCASKKSLIILSDNGKRHNTIIITTSKGSTEVNKVGGVVTLTSKNDIPKVNKIISKEEIRAKFNNLYSAIPKKPIVYIVYFKTGSLELTEKSKEIFNRALETIKKRSPCVVDIIGHTDTTGSSNMNMKLSLNRANLIKSIIRKKRLNIVSLVAKGYGDKVLLVKTKKNVSEERNRNVEIFIK